MPGGERQQHALCLVQEQEGVVSFGAVVDISRRFRGVEIRHVNLGAAYVSSEALPFS